MTQTTHAQVAVRVSLDERELIEAAARQDRRTLSAYIRSVVMEKIEADNQTQKANGHSKQERLSID